jgi:MFS family permease
VAESSEINPADGRAILTVTSLAAFLFFNSFGSISVALPVIQKQFASSLAEIQWVTLMGVVTIASLSFCFGRAGTRFGQLRLYKARCAAVRFGRRPRGNFDFLGRATFRSWRDGGGASDGAAHVHGYPRRQFRAA